MKVMLSNADIIREFILESIEKKEVLLANSCLHAQIAYKTNQLIAKKEGIIATANLTSSPAEFLIHAQSSYWELINELLAEHSYIFTGEIDTKGFYHYKYCSLPTGYQLQCTKSFMLWQTWRKYLKNTATEGMQPEILVHTKDSWQGIKDLSISDGLLYVKTLVNELSFHSEDLVIWSSQIQPSYEG